MTAQQDMAYGRQGGAWASKPESSKTGHKTVVPVRGAPFPLVELALHSWGEQPAELLAEIPFRTGRCVLRADQLGQPYYQWRTAA